MNLKVIIRRLLASVGLLFLLATLLFFLLRFAPGGPFDGERALPEEVKQALDAAYGLDQPIFTQYGRWLAQSARGNLGESFQHLGVPVTEIIHESIGPSITIGGIAFVLAILLGIVTGVIAASRWNRPSDQLLLLISHTGISLPNFLLASLLILYFSLKLDWLPPALWESKSSAVLPILSLAFRPWALIHRLTRSEMLENLHSDYLRTARAKGLSEWRVYFKHALKNALIPVLSYAGPILAALLTGSFVIELVFQIPGLGKYFVSAVMNRDYPLVMGVTLTFGVFLILCNLITDLVAYRMDPRLNEEGRPA